MKNLILSAVAMCLLAAAPMDSNASPRHHHKHWSKKAKGTIIGAGTGAVVGGVLGGGKGAAVGAAVGGGSGYLIGRHKDRHPRTHR